jgi:hypothetical protein
MPQCFLCPVFYGRPVSMCQYLEKGGFPQCSFHLVFHYVLIKNYLGNIPIDLVSLFQMVFSFFVKSFFFGDFFFEKRVHRVLWAPI